MHLTRLTLHHFRNIAAAELTLGAGITLILGANGQGKSNVLEGIGLLARGRSFRRATPDEMRQTGAREFRIDGWSTWQGMTHHLVFTSRPGRLEAHWDGKRLPSLSSLGQALTAVISAPETLRLIQGGPLERRNYLDWLCFAHHRPHAAECREAQQALQARNLLLRQGRGSEAEMAAWEEQIAALGARISQRRRLATHRLIREATPHYPLVNLVAERVSIRFLSQLDRMNPDWEDQALLTARYRTQLAQQRPGDRRRGVTTVGPHRDDVALELDGRPMGDYASHGQQKRFLLAIKLAEVAWLRQVVGATPLFLLDDPTAELDPPAIAALMTALPQTGGQVILALCDPAPLRGVVVPEVIWLVEDGRFTRLSTLPQG